MWVIIMFIYKGATRNNKTYLTISRGVRDSETKKTKNIHVKKYGSHDLNSEAGKKVYLQIENDLKELQKLENETKTFHNISDFFNALQTGNIEYNQYDKNIGFIPYLSIFKQLKLPSFFSKLAKNTKIEYSYSNMMFYQIIQRLFYPGSKLSISTDNAKNKYLQDFNFVNENNIYSSLDIFSKINKDKLASLNITTEIVDKVTGEITSQNEDSLEMVKLIKEYNDNFRDTENSLFKHLNTHIGKIVPDRNISLAFYDCTTYYFESFTEDELRERGMSKDNKRNETQVVMGLLIDSNGIPISYKLFRGNQHELHTMEQVIDDVLHNYKIKEIIIVADRGLNSKKNLDMIRNKGLNYIVGSKGNSIPSNLRERKYDESWNLTSSKDSNYRSGYVTSTRDVTINSKTHKELIIKKYSDIYYQRELLKQNEGIERAKKRLKDKTYKASAKSFSRYFEPVDNSNKKIQFKIDDDKILKEQENFGYFYIVTNKLNMDPIEIMKAYRGLYKIEESFRILKTNLKARPVYHYKERRIRAHFLICYIALVLQRVLEYQLESIGIQLSTHEIINGLKEFEVSQFDIKQMNIFTIKKEVLESKVNTEIFKLSKKDINESSLLKLRERFVLFK